MTSTAAATAKILADAGIERVFGLPGGEVLVLMDELRRAGVDFVLMRHEANAGIAAAVYGKLRRQPGVVLTTLGPGAANLMLPMANAYLDREPLLAISAQIPDDFPASHTHQLLPLHETYRPIARYVEKITGSNVLDVVPQALARCMEHPFGVSYLTLSAREALKAAATGETRPVATTPLSSASAREQATQLVSALRGSKRPLVVIGLGVDPANAAPIRRWLTEWNLPVAVTPKVKGIVDETSATFVGVVGGMAADGVLCDAIAAADLVVGFGLDPVEIDKTWHAERPIHWLLESPNACGIVPAEAALVSHHELLDVLADERPAAAWPQPFREFQDKRMRMLTDRTPSAGTMWPGDIIAALASVMPPETIVTTDVGSHKFLFGQVLAEPRAGDVLDVERVIGDGVRVERRDRRQAGAARGAGAGGGRRRRLLDERAGARERGACRRAVHHGRARGRQLLAHQDLAGGKEAGAVPDRVRADRHREDGGVVRGRQPAHQRPRRTRIGRPARGRRWPQPRHRRSGERFGLLTPVLKNRGRISTASRRPRRCPRLPSLPGEIGHTYDRAK